MRLYLSSFLLGSDPGAFAAMVSGNTRCGLILNALDNVPDARDRFRLSQTKALEALGLQVEELDLRHFFGSAGRLADVLAGLGALWICGGNAFLLRKAMRQSGFDVVIREMLQNDVIVYAGFSAAAVVTGADLRGLPPTQTSFDTLEAYDLGRLGHHAVLRCRSL